MMIAWCIDTVCNAYDKLYLTWIEQSLSQSNSRQCKEALFNRIRRYHYHWDPAP